MQATESDETLSLRVLATRDCPYALTLVNKFGNVQAEAETVLGLIDRFLQRGLKSGCLPVLLRAAMIRRIREKVVFIGSLQAEYLRELLLDLEAAEQQEREIAGVLLMSMQMDGPDNA